MYLKEMKYVEEPSAMISVVLLATVRKTQNKTKN